MEALAKSDIFFLLTGVSVIFVTILVIVALYYVIKILRGVQDLTDRVRKEGEEIINDVHKARTKVKKGGKKLASIINSTSGKRSRKSKK